MSLLVSDMVGSTQLRVRLGAEGERLVRLHESLARDAVAAHGGQFVKALGDGAMAVFDAAADAVAAAVRLQRQVAALHRRGDADGLQVRIGVSAGDIAVGSDDCYGLPVAEAVRLCAAAGTGEILVADVVRALARRLDAPLTAAGALELKGLDDPVIAWRVDWRQRSGAAALLPLPTRLTTPPTGRLVGRETLLAQLVERASATMAGGPGRLLLLEGEPGVGKSATAAELARRLAESFSAVVLHGGCDEELQPPYHPFAQSLRHLVRHLPLELLDPHVRRNGGDVAVLVPELTDRLGTVRAPRSTAQASDRYLLFAAISDLLSVVLAESPLVLVLDDLQWADRASLMLLRHLVVSSELSGLHIVATLRSGDVDPSGALLDLLAELHRVDGVERVELAGLAGDELAELVTSMVEFPDAVDRLTAAVYRETEGNPFFAIELLRHLRESRQHDVEPLLTDLPASVREVIRRRVARLGPDCGSLLTAGAVLGVEFDLPLVSDLAGMTEDVSLDLLEAACAASLVREVPGRSRFRFVHALVQRTLYDDLSQTRRRRLHRGAAQAMEARSAAPSATAAQWVAAGDAADPLGAMAACAAAADEALRLRAPDDAAHWYREALSLAPLDDQQLRCELLLRLGEAQRLAGDPAHRDTLLDAGRLAQRLPDPERLARAALARTRWFSSSVTSGGDDTQLELLESALAAIGDQPSATRARLLATLTAELVYTDRAETRFAVADEALQIARALDDPMTLFDVLFRRMPAARHPNRAGAGEELDELRRLVADGQDPLRLAMADVITVLRGYETGQLSTADAALHRAVALSEELRLPVLRWLVTVLRGTRAALAGALGDAEKLAMEALAQSEATEQPDAVTWFGVQLYMIRYEQGRLDELTDLVDGALSRSPRLYTWHGAGAMAFAELGREDRARELVTVMLDADYPSRQSEPHWLIGMSCLGSAVAELGDGAAAQRLYAALHTSGGQWASIMPLSLGSIERVLGELALAADRAADAERHFRAAIASNDAGPAPSFAARSRLGLLRALRAQGIAMDAAEPAELAAAVEQAADRYGLVRVAQLLERERARR